MAVKNVLSVILEHELQNGDIDKLIQDLVNLILKSGVKNVAVTNNLVEQKQ